MKLAAFLTLGALACAGARAAKNSCMTEFTALGAASQKTPTAQCAPFQAL